MLEIIIPARENWNDDKQEFVTISKEYVLKLEHSLVSLSKWESRWCKPFLSNYERTYEETIDYIKCMTLTQNVPASVYDGLTRENVESIISYINAPMTATWFSDDTKNKRNDEIVTAELIYYWMIIYNIPSDYQKWHLNKLMTLIRICNIKNSKGEKLSTNETVSLYARINAARKKQLNTTG